MRRLSLLLLVVLSCAVPCLAGTIVGHVFLDANGDGAWQPTDKAVRRRTGERRPGPGDDRRRRGLHYRRARRPRGGIRRQPLPGVAPPQGSGATSGPGPAPRTSPCGRRSRSCPSSSSRGRICIRAPMSATRWLATSPRSTTFLCRWPSLFTPVTWWSTRAASPWRRREPSSRPTADRWPPSKPPLFNLPGNHEHVSWVPRHPRPG